MKNKLVKTIFALLLIQLMTFCTQKVNILENALISANENREELEKVLNHFNQNPSDSLKYKAACFLIENMELHGNMSYKIVDAENKKVEINPMDYLNREKARQAKDSIIFMNNLKEGFFSDLHSLQADFIIKNIEEAFYSWENSPWFESISFSQFCSTILPYRAYYEPISEWRTHLRNKYMSVLDSLSSQSIINAAIAINNELAKDIKYDNRFMAGLGLQNITEMLQSKTGMCDDLSVFGVCAMRACGIPAAVDYTLWGRINAGHNWSVIFDENGKAISFGAGEQNPGEHIKIFSQVAYRKLPKVFRHTFEKNPNSLVAQIDNIDKLPPFLASENMFDVTNNYIECYDISIPVNTKINNGIAYICIFNYGEWKPIHWSEIKKSKAVFSDMGSGIVYITALYEDGKVIPISLPFFLNKDGSIDYFTGSDNQYQTVTFKKWLGGLGAVTNGDKHKLYGWLDNKWTFLQEVWAKDSLLIFTEVPPAPLYKFEGNSRIFRIEDGNPIWH